MVLWRDITDLLHHKDVGELVVRRRRWRYRDQTTRKREETNNNFQTLCSSEQVVWMQQDYEGA